MRKRYYSLSAKLDHLFSLTKSFSLDKLMELLPSTESDIVARAIAWEERKEWEQWHPRECACSRCEEHGNMLAGRTYDETDIHDYEHPQVWAEYAAFSQKTIFFDRHTAFLMQALAQEQQTRVMAIYSGLQTN